jgi:O-antigen ligase
MDAYKEVTEVRVSEDVNVGGNVDQRVMVWKVAAGIVKDYPLGVGNGDIHDEMNKRLLKIKQKAAVDVNINAHNQYLETAMGLGIPGLLLLLSLLFFLFRKSVLNKDFLLFFFTFVLFTNALFESLLNTQAGTVFFAFVFSILLFSKDYSIRESN